MKNNNITVVIDRQVENDWTGRITFHCLEEVNLYDNSIYFEVTNGVKIDSLWGIDGDTQWKQDNKGITVSVTKWYPEGTAYVLPANIPVTIVFAPLSNDYKIQNFKIGGNTPVSNTGKLDITTTLPYSDNSGLDIKYTLTDPSGKVVRSGVLNYSDYEKTTIINDLPASEQGISYTLKTPNFDCKGTTYVADKPTRTVTIKTNQTTSEEVSYTKQSADTITVNFNVTNLPQDTSTKITLKNTVSGEEKNQSITASGVCNFTITKNNNQWNVNVVDIDGYNTSLSKNSFIANESQNIQISFKETSHPSNKALAVTYFCLWGGNKSYNVSGKQIITKAIDINNVTVLKDFCQYDVIIFAFIVTKNGQFELAYGDPGATNPHTTYSKEQIKAFIQYMQSQGKQVLVSLGGQFFTIHWESANFSQIQAIIDEYGFDGIDLDFEGGAIPTPSTAQIAAQKIMALVNHYRQQQTFWLTAAPEWGYVIPYSYHRFENQGYVHLFHYIGMENITYIWPQTYNQGSANGVIGHEKNKVSPLDGMAKFLAAITWAASSDAGYAENGAKAPHDFDMKIPVDKLVLGIPATEGAAGSDMLYVATPEIMRQSWSLMKAQGTMAAGFMNWSADFDATQINDGDLSPGYSHQPWDTVKTIKSLDNDQPTPAGKTTIHLQTQGLQQGQSGQVTLSSAGQSDVIINYSNPSATVSQDSTQWNVVASSITGYSVDCKPSSFTADKETVSITVTYSNQPQPGPSADKKIIGYWENWGEGITSQNSQDYIPLFKPYTHVLYSFLTLDESPARDDWGQDPHEINWKGQAIYESGTHQPIMNIMNAAQYSSYDYYTKRIKAMIEAAHSQNKKFIWAIGGWSDLQYTLEPNQINAFIDQCVALLKQYGDGIDFDWEHLSQLARDHQGQSNVPNPKAKEQLETLAKILLTLRQALDDAGLHDKQIGYTTRFNAFMKDSRDYGFYPDASNKNIQFLSDGEGLAINNWLKNNGSSLNEVVNWVNIMAYDIAPANMSGKTWNMGLYQSMLKTFADHVNPKLVALGFEPGDQAAGGQWEGMDIDKQAIDYINTNNYGGVMFWAINEKADNNAKNVKTLSEYAQGQFIVHNHLDILKDFAGNMKAFGEKWWGESI